MTIGKRLSTVVVLLLLTATSAWARPWWEPYQEGIEAAKEGKWDAVIEKMTEAIGVKKGEGKRQRAYGVVILDYHPYYYRGIAQYKKKRYAEAVSDLQAATGTGPYNAGGTHIEWLNKAEEKADEGPAPAPRQDPTPTPPTPTPRPDPIPTPPSGPDPAIAEARRGAEGALRQAEQARNAAQSAGATSRASGEFSGATQQYLSAKGKAAAARSAGDWNEVGDLADSAKRAFDFSAEKSRMSAPSPTPGPGLPPPPGPRPTPSPTGPVPDAGEAILERLRDSVRQALDAYYEGRFRDSASAFESLSRQQSKNPLVWAYLGASNYSWYYLGGESKEELRTKAVNAFRKAKTLKMRELPAEYFSPRIQKFYRSIQ